MQSDEDFERIPTKGSYRKIGLHAGQSPDRLRVVKTDIDRVAAMTDLTAQFDAAGNCALAPEARILAAAMCEAGVMKRASNGARPDISLEKLRARVAGADSLEWQSPTHYASDLDWNSANAVPREPEA